MPTTTLLPSPTSLCTLPPTPPCSIDSLSNYSQLSPSASPPPLLDAESLLADFPFDYGQVRRTPLGQLPASTTRNLDSYKYPSLQPGIWMRHQLPSYSSRPRPEKQRLTVECHSETKSGHAGNSIRLNKASHSITTVVKLRGLAYLSTCIRSFEQVSGEARQFYGACEDCIAFCLNSVPTTRHHANSQS